MSEANFCEAKMSEANFCDAKMSKSRIFAKLK